MEYKFLVEVGDRLDATSSTLERTAGVAETLADELLPELSLLLRGRLFAPWEAAELSVSSPLATDTIAATTGVDVRLRVRPLVPPFRRLPGRPRTRGRRHVREGATTLREPVRGSRTDVATAEWEPSNPARGTCR